MYHVLNRGGQREDIFLDEEDRQKFLATLEESCRKTDWQVHAYCLMRDHFHLVIETPNANLVAGMHWLSGVYTKRFNIRHKLCGHVLAGRYKALIVEGSGNGYLRTVCDYVHLNPVRAKLLRAEEPLEAFPWSSYGWYLKAPAQRPAWLRVDRLLGEKGIPKDSEAGRQSFALQMEGRRAEESSAGYEEIRGAWFVGSEQFRQELLAAASERIGLNHYGSSRYETGVQKAERIISEALQGWGWQEKDLGSRPKGDQCKVTLARRLRAETTMTLKWIAQRLEMGSWTYVSNLLHERPLQPRQQQLPLCQ